MSDETSIGDLLSLLPVLHHEYEMAGRKPAVVVPRSCRQITEMLDYVDTIVYDGDMDEVGRVAKFARSRTGNELVHGKGPQFKPKHPSYQYDQWDWAGRLNQWDKLQLVLPRVEVNGFVPRFSFIVLCDNCEGFQFIESLYSALVDAFPQHRILRTSQLNHKRLLELVPLFDAAALIVAIDSVELHLAKASDRPIIALINDQPTRWHGSAWSEQFLLHVRYGDYERRKDEIIRVAKASVEGKDAPAVLKGEMTNQFGYNLGMIWHGDVLMTTHRHHPQRGHWKTKLAIHDGVLTSDIIFPPDVEDYSSEDARLFHFNGKLMISYVLARMSPDRKFRTICGYGALLKREGRWHVEQHYQPIYRNNDWSGVVKNICPFEYEGKVHFIWGIEGGQQEIIEVVGDAVLNKYTVPEPKWDYGEIRGGAIIKRGDKLLRFFHSRSGNVHWGGHGTFQYHVGASIMEATPPFKTLQVSTHPILSGDERYAPGCFHWKPNCCLPYGAIMKNGTFLLSVGRNDSSAEIVQLNEADLNL